MPAAININFYPKYIQKMRSFDFVLVQFVVIILFWMSLTVTAQQKPDHIEFGSSLAPNTELSSWLSPSGLYAFGFYQHGDGSAVGVFLAGIPERTVVWTANRDNPQVSREATLLFSSSGKLLISQSRQGPEIEITSSFPSASYASMLDSGNFVIFNSRDEMIWQSFNQPTDTILPTQRLLAGMELISSVSETNQSLGLFRLKMQQDGNLVQYPSDALDEPQSAYWASGTNGRGDNVTLNLDEDGGLFLLNSTSYRIKNIAEGYPTVKGRTYLMRIDSDGIFRLYSLNQNNSLSVLWESSKDKCDPKGLCGFNSFCDLHDHKPDCRCLPGLAFVNYRGNRGIGCERNFSAESCFNGPGSLTYTIQELENTTWEDVSYSVQRATTKELCRQACLQDCRCDAALFIGGDCRLKRLPLKYGRRLMDTDRNPNDIAFIKVYTSKASSDKFLPSGGKNVTQTHIIVILSCSFALFILILATLGIVIHNYRLKSYERITSNGSTVGFCEDIVLRSFRYAEIAKMTDGFKEEIGRGSSGTVYKGTMVNGKVVAVKKLRKEVSRGEAEFQTEMKVIARTHHRNLVRLLGYSCDAPNKVLVYDYMSNGSLADIIFAPGKQPNWDERMKIAYGIARGILYLHDECESQIIHCDIKPQNVLIDEYNSAKISDFGLAKLMKSDQTKTFTGIRGTRGYVAPEWYRNLPVTVKADVYSFGIVFLEIICCRRCVDLNLPENQIVLQEWVYQCFEAGELGQLVGDEAVEIIQLERMVKLALWCILDEPSLRPSMINVLFMFEGKVEIPTPPTPTFFVSAV